MGAPGRQRAIRRDAQANRTRLLAAARQVFAESGLQASLEEVARRADVSVGTLYHHFGDRTTLIDAALIVRVEESVELARRALNDPDPWRALTSHLEAIAELQSNDRGFTEVCVFALPTYTRTEIAKADGRAFTSELVARAHAAGVLRRDVGLTDLDLLTWAVIRATDGIRSTHAESWRRHLAILFDALRPTAAHSLPGDPLSPSEVHAAMSFAAQTPRHHRAPSERLDE